MKIEIIKCIKRKIPFSLAEIETKTRKVLRLLKIKRGWLNVVIVSDPFIRKLNFRFLKRDSPTDVLAFGEDVQRGRDRISGEVVISWDTARRVARRYAKQIEEEFFLYLIHGILHLKGYTDRSLKESRVMEERQSKILLELLNEKKQ